MTTRTRRARCAALAAGASLASVTALVTSGAALGISGGRPTQEPPPTTGGAPVAVATPEIVGRPLVNELLRCRRDEWVSPPATRAWTWFRDRVQLAGETSRALRVASADVGHRLRCSVTASSEAGSTTVSSEAVGVGRTPVWLVHATLPRQSGPTLRFAGRVHAAEPAVTGIVDVLRGTSVVARGAPAADGSFRLEATIPQLWPGAYDFDVRFLPHDPQLFAGERQTITVGVTTPSTFPFPRSRLERRPTLFDRLPRFWNDGLRCSTGCRPKDARDGWPLEPFHEQHALRAGINEHRDSGFQPER